MSSKQPSKTMHKMGSHSTIAAISTPPGKGGVAVIRISGAEAFQIADRIFIPKNKKPLSQAAARMQIPLIRSFCSLIPKS